MEVTLKGKEAEKYLKKMNFRLTWKRPEGYFIGLEFQTISIEGALLTSNNIEAIFKSFTSALDKMKVTLHRSYYNSKKNRIILMVSIQATKSPADVSKMLKMASSRLIKKNKMFEQYYCDNKFWSTGYRTHSGLPENPESKNFILDYELYIESSEK